MRSWIGCFFLAFLHGCRKNYLFIDSCETVQPSVKKRQPNRHEISAFPVSDPVGILCE